MAEFLRIQPRCKPWAAAEQSPRAAPSSLLDAQKKNTRIVRVSDLVTIAVELGVEEFVDLVLFLCPLDGSLVDGLELNRHRIGALVSRRRWKDTRREHRLAHVR